jgi:hypothetical protein
MLAVVLFVAFLTLGPAQSQQPATPSSAPAVLVELFTSEGCSSCPPADRFIEYLDAQPLSGATLIVLSEHVDYWDRKGWKDPYSSSAATERQLMYGQRFRLKDVYTPQFVIDGTRESLADDAKILSAIRESAEAKKIGIQLKIDQSDAHRMRVRVETEPVVSTASTVDVYLAIALDHAMSRVGGGENAHRVLSHTAVVKQLMKVGSLKRGEQFSRDVELKTEALANQSLRVVVFLQEHESGKVYGAAVAHLSTQ